MVPINKLSGLDFLEMKEENYFSFGKQIREKYGISNELMKLILSMSFEELIALRLEQMLNLFNGKIMFPLNDYLKSMCARAIYTLIEAYPESKEKKRILRALMINRKTRMKMASLYEVFIAKQNNDQTKL